MAKITEFKKGDVLTRNEPITYPTGVVDSSYCGDKMILLEISEESKMFRMQHPDFEQTFSYARDLWDEGWCIYPFKN